MVTTKTRQNAHILLALIVLGFGTRPAPAQDGPPTSETFRFHIDSKTPVKDLLPIPHKSGQPSVVIVADLAMVPEVHFQEPIIVRALKGEGKAALAEASRKARIQTAHQIAKINFLNAKKTDGFLESLVANRADLSGLPFMMGDACRIKEGERKAFGEAVGRIREALAYVENRAKKTRSDEDDFWQHYRNGRKTTEDRAHLTALMQMMGPKSAAYRVGLVKSFPTHVRAESGQGAAIETLARLAVFSMDEEVRRAATDALNKSDTSFATPVLLRGLRYPWPDVARSTAQIVVNLKRTDLIPELVKMLEEPDPRAPVQQGEKGSVVREVVRINHHRNCLLCHAPGTTPDVIKIKQRGDTRNIGDGVESIQVWATNVSDAVVAAVPTPGEDLRANSVGYYSPSTPDILVRADVTYLRQDFSLLQKVADAAPWPEMQRFDFLVRNRAVNAKEAEAYQAEFAKADSPYHAAALMALRRLTGQDAGNSAAAWRTALRLTNQ